MSAVIKLASNSPRRRELLALAGWAFEVSPAEIDENPFPDEDPVDYVRRMAVTKAKSAGESLAHGELAIAADTTVVDGQNILGKPANDFEAFEMLRRLRNRSHKVLTAIAVIRAGDPEPESDICTTLVPMRAYTEKEMTQYIASGDPFDKAGGYAIQNRSFNPVAALTGCYANVVGLPLCHLVRLLRQLGLHPETDISANCQKTLEYDCTIYPEILN